MRDFWDNFWLTIGIAVVVSLPISYGVHVLWGIVTLTGAATTSQAVLFIFGTIVFPIGILHGYYLIFLGVVGLF